MSYTPRRPLNDDGPDGYLESDRDYLLNNRLVAVALLDMLPELLEALNLGYLTAKERIEQIYLAFEKSEIRELLK